ncbi:DUF1648 domain-containing protein [Microbacterium lacus]|uniref:DUF1648 domain-containing protein n=1 Tax=Microbacterium lacus TaxID=415217 RepID=UPI00384AEE7E
MTDIRSSLAVRRFTLVAVVIPAGLTLAALVVQLLALPDVPGTIAIHWGPTGQADGFGPAWVNPLVTLVAGLGLPLLIALICLPGLRRGDSGPTYRLMGTVAASVSALIGVLASGTLVTQRGLADAVDAPSVIPVLIVAVLAALVVGLVAWFIQPTQEVRNVTSVPASGITLAPGEHAAWFKTAEMGRGATLVIGVTCALLAGTALFVWFAGGPPSIAVILGALTLFLIATSLMTLAFTVRVDGAGLSVVSLVGFPRFTVPLGDVSKVQVSDVSPMGEFGGYGIRSVVGATGIVLRRGPAISVDRVSGRRFVVTVDDAARGGALLESLARREATPQG